MKRVLWASDCRAVNVLEDVGQQFPTYLDLFRADGYDITHIMDQPTSIEYSTTFDLLKYLDEVPHTEFDHVVLQSSTDWIPQDKERLAALIKGDHYYYKLMHVFGVF